MAGISRDKYSNHSEPENMDLTSSFVWVDKEACDALAAAEQKEIQDSLEQFAVTETMAHTRTGAYGAPSRQGDEIILFKEHANGPNIAFQAKKIKTKSAGLVAEIFIPVDTTASNTIYINWTGTHNVPTIVADLEKGGPGEESYRKEELDILQQINQCVASVAKRSDRKLNIVVTGHSLGGALAQLNTHTLERAIATNIYENAMNKQNTNDICQKWIKAEMKYRESLGSKVTHTHNDIPYNKRNALTPEIIGSLTVGTWNAAGVVKPVEKSSNRLASILSQAGVKVRGLFGMVGGDAVQRTSQGTILSNVAHEDAEVSLLKTDVKVEGFTQKLVGGLGLGFLGAGIGMLVMGLPGAVLGGLALGLFPMAKATLKAHTSKHLESQFEKQSEIDPEEIDFRLYRNSTPEGRAEIHKKLTNKSSFLQLPGVTRIQKGLHYTFEHITSKSNHHRASEKDVSKDISVNDSINRFDLSNW